MGYVHSSPTNGGNAMRSTIRWCEDIGMFAYDRPIPTSCVHATGFCRAHCYNDKLYRMYPAMREKDAANEAFWQAIDGDRVRNDLAGRRKRQTRRVRFMTRGEALRDHSDIARVRDILTGNPDTLFWIPTRAWRDPLLRIRIETEIMPLANAVVLASMDPTNTREDWASLKLAGWSTMVFGDDAMTHTPAGDRVFACPKTHKGLKGHCAICKAGCFAPRTLGRRVDVHLSQH